MNAGAVSMVSAGVAAPLCSSVLALLESGACHPFFGSRGLVNRTETDLTETPDYSAFKGDKIQLGGNLMTQLTALADEQQAAEAEVERLEALLEEAKTNLRRITEHDIPELLDGLDGRMKLPDKREIVVTEKIRANVPKEKKPFAMKWLDDNGHGAIVKRRFIIEFGKDQEALVRQFEEQLAKSPTPLNVKKEHNVHWQTLDAFVREQLEEGGLPLDLFGVYRQKFTKIVPAPTK